MNFRSYIASKARGLAIGFGIPDDPGTDHKTKKVFGPWTVIVTSDTPLTMSFADLLQIRKLAQLPVSVPIILFGFGEGNKTVRGLLVSRLIHPWGVGVFGDVPGFDWGSLVWASLGTRVVAGDATLQVQVTPGGGTDTLLQGLGLQGKGITPETSFKTWEKALEGLATLAGGPVPKKE